MHYLLIYHTVENYVERRAPFRDEHLGYSDAAHARGELFMGGAVGDPPDTAMLIFRADTPVVAEELPATIPTSRPA